MLKVIDTEEQYESYRTRLEALLDTFPKSDVISWEIGLLIVLVEKWEMENAKIDETNLDDSKLILENAKSFAFVHTYCDSALSLMRYQMEQRIPENGWLFYYWTEFKQGSKDWFRLRDMVKGNNKYPDPKTLQQAIISECKKRVNWEIEQDIRQQDTEASEPIPDFDDYYKKRGSNFYNDNADMNQQSQDFWDNLENENNYEEESHD